MRIRVGLAIFSVLLVIGILGYTVYSWEDVRIVKDREFNELIKAGIQLKVEQSRSEFQLALLIMAALWALKVAKRDEAQLVLSDVPELLMFCSASLLLLISSGYQLLVLTL